MPADEEGSGLINSEAQMPGELPRRWADMAEAPAHHPRFHFRGPLPLLAQPATAFVRPPIQGHPWRLTFRTLARAGIIFSAAWWRWCGRMVHDGLLFEALSHLGSRP